MDFKNINNYLGINNLSNSINNSNKRENENKPKLIEPGVKYFFNGILRECHFLKEKNYTFFYNIFMLMLFIVVIGSILFFKFKGNKSNAEIYNKNLKDKQYIISKLVYYNKMNIENQQRVQNNMITNLPDYSNHPEASLLHKKIYF